MAAGMIRSLRPRGKPQSARTCCSNWQTVAASMVRCPELCGRGAISLTSKRPPGRQEELDTKDADRPQRLGHGQGQRAGLESDDRSHGGRHHRRVQDVPLMVVQADRIGHRVAVLPASHDHRDLGGELDPALGHAGDPAQAGPRGGRLGRLRDQHLPLAVVPRAGGFQDQGKTEGPHRRRRARPRSGPAARGRAGWRCRPGSSSRAAGSGWSRRFAIPAGRSAAAPAIAGPGPRHSRTRR